MNWNLIKCLIKLKALSILQALFVQFQAPSLQEKEKRLQFKKV